jgi:hypothetical protein
VYSRRRRPGWHVARARTTLNVMNARAKKLLDELLTLSVEDRALITVELNGTVILDADVAGLPSHLEDHVGKDRTEGFFGFCGHNDAVAFRNIYIAELGEGDGR